MSALKSYADVHDNPLNNVAYYTQDNVVISEGRQDIMLKRFVWVGAAIILSSMLSSCGSEPSSASSEPMSYKDMKSMVIDILKTEDAQKALQESAISTTGNNGMTSKLLTVQDQEQVSMAVKETLGFSGVQQSH